MVSSAFSRSLATRLRLDVLDKPPDVKGKQIEVARLWAAFLVAVQAVVKTRDTPPASSAALVVDMELSLEEGEKATMMQSSMKFLDWLTRWSVECFHNCAVTPVTLIRVESVGSAFPSTSPIEERRLLPLPPSPQRGPSIPVEERHCLWAAYFCGGTGSSEDARHSAGLFGRIGGGHGTLA